METALSIALGLGLSAACGFRVFLPFLVAGVGAMLGYLPLTEEFSWIGTVPAVVVFGTATIVEIAAYYLPWVDNLLDTIATPAAVIAGIIAAASVMTDMPPLLRWTVALIGGGTIAGLVQGGTAAARVGSSLVTGGLGNFVLATAEWIGSMVVALLSLLVPLAGVLLATVILFVLIRLRRRPRTDQINTDHRKRPRGAVVHD